MTTYIQAQFDKARDLASAESDTIQFTLQIAGPVGKTNHLNITITQLNAIQKILEGLCKQNWIACWSATMQAQSPEPISNG